MCSPLPPTHNIGPSSRLNKTKSPCFREREKVNVNSGKRGKNMVLVGIWGIYQQKEIIAIEFYPSNFHFPDIYKVKKKMGLHFIACIVTVWQPYP